MAGNRYLAKTRLNATEKGVLDYLTSRVGSEREAIRVAILEFGRALYEQEKKDLANGNTKGDNAEASTPDSSGGPSPTDVGGTGDGT